MAFALARARQYSCVGSASETTFYTEWGVARSVFPRMSLHSEWDCRQWYPKDIMVPTEGTSLADTNDSGFISDLDYSPSGRLLAASSSSNTVFVLDPNIRPRDPVLVIDKPHRDAISKVLFVGDYQFVTGSADSNIGFWDIRKSSEALNFLTLHKQPIRSLQHFPEKDYLVSSCQEGIIRFWHLPSFSVRREAQEEDPHTRGVLLKCPNLRQCYFSEVEQLAVFSNIYNSLFIIHNLDIDHLTEDLDCMIFDDSLSMQLCWIRPNAMPNRRNRVKIANSSDYSPLEFATVSQLSHLSINRSSLCLMRLKTSGATLSGNKMEWTCVARLKEDLSSDKPIDPLDQYIKTFGSNVLSGMLLYVKDEDSYAHFREKQPSFSHCGRVIASPDKQGVNLLKFTPELDVCLSPTKPSIQSNLDTLFEADDGTPTPSLLEEITCLPTPQNSALCCRFSHTDWTLLAVGDTEAKINFYRPKL